jgi:hypothetical protein
VELTLDEQKDDKYFERRKRNNLAAKKSRDQVNFHQHFLLACRSQKRKKTDGLTIFLALLGSVSIKAARKMLEKLTPGKVSQTR